MDKDRRSGEGDKGRECVKDCSVCTLSKVFINWFAMDHHTLLGGVMTEVMKFMTRHDASRSAS